MMSSIRANNWLGAEVTVVVGKMRDFDGRLRKGWSVLQLEIPNGGDRNSRLENFREAAALLTSRPLNSVVEDGQIR